MSFVGQVCNMSGCWPLVSNISAEAGASLPITSTMLSTRGLASGEWIVAYNGPAGQTGNWQSQITAGEIVMFTTSSGSGHITTVVSGSGSSAMVVDNMAFEDQNGQITNFANDGAWDIIISQPHAASYEWGVAVPGSVVVYELDCPTIKVVTPTSRVAVGGSIQLAPLFIASNPLASQAITEYQFYDSRNRRCGQRQFSAQRLQRVRQLGRQCGHRQRLRPVELELAGRQFGRNRHHRRACLQRLLLGRLAEVHRQSRGTRPGRQRADADPDLAGGAGGKLCAGGEYIHRPAGPDADLQRQSLERRGTAVLAAIQRLDPGLHRHGSVQRRRLEYRGVGDKYQRAHHLGNLRGPDPGAGAADGDQSDCERNAARVAR